MPSSWSPFSSGCFLRLIPLGGSAFSPDVSVGMMTMKMMRRTSITSTSGVTFGSALTELPPPPADIPIVNLSCAGVSPGAGAA